MKCTASHKETLESWQAAAIHIVTSMASTRRLRFFDDAGTGRVAHDSLTLLEVESPDLRKAQDHFPIASWELPVEMRQATWILVSSGNDPEFGEFLCDESYPIEHIFGVKAFAHYKY